MAASHKDWELPNSRIWLAAVDNERGLDFPIYVQYVDQHLDRLHFVEKRLQLKYKSIDYFLLKILLKVSKSLRRKQCKEDKQILADLSSVHRRSQENVR